jgi:hypothetical protein
MTSFQRAESLVVGCMTMVGGVQVCLGFLNISRWTEVHSADIPLAQTLRRVVISTRCSVASREPSSKVWNANSLVDQLADCLRHALADLDLCSSSESMIYKCIMYYNDKGKNRTSFRATID